MQRLEGSSAAGPPVADEEALQAYTIQVVTGDSSDQAKHLLMTDVDSWKKSVFGVSPVMGPGVNFDEVSQDTLTISATALSLRGD